MSLGLKTNELINFNGRPAFVVKDTEGEPFVVRSPERGELEKHKDAMRRLGLLAELAEELDV